MTILNDTTSLTITLGLSTPRVVNYCTRVVNYAHIEHLLYRHRSSCDYHNMFVVFIVTDLFATSSHDKGLNYCKESKEHKRDRSRGKTIKLIKNGAR